MWGGIVRLQHAGEAKGWGCQIRRAYKHAKTACLDPKRLQRSAGGGAGFIRVFCNEVGEKRRVRDACDAWASRIRHWVDAAAAEGLRSWVDAAAAEGLR